MYWLLVGLVRSLKSSHNEAVKKPLLKIFFYISTKKTLGIDSLDKL